MAANTFPSASLKSPTTNSRSQVFAAGEIVPGLQVLDAVGNGTVEMGNTAMYYYWGKDPAFTFGCALPFGLNARQMISWVRHGGGEELLNDLLKDHNCIGFAAANTGAPDGRMVPQGNSDNRRSKRSKIPRRRFCGSDFLAKLGTVPQQLAAGDIYPALEKGTIDAAEWVGPYDDEKLGFYKIASTTTRLVGRVRSSAQSHQSSQMA